MVDWNILFHVQNNFVENKWSKFLEKQELLDHAGNHSKSSDNDYNKNIIKNDNNDEKSDKYDHENDNNDKN